MIASLYTNSRLRATAFQTSGQQHFKLRLILKISGSTLNPTDLRLGCNEKLSQKLETDN
jgi:hypothetical protein